MSYPNFYKFKITEKLGDRICYTLYEAIDQTTEERLFLKVLDDRRRGQESSVYQFLKNAQLLKSIQHPNICNIRQFGTDVGHYYIATEPIELEPIGSLIQDEFSLSFEDLIEIFHRIGRTLRQTHLHGLVHGLLNPNNIYIGSDGSIKIDDFGLSWCIPDLLRISSEESLYLAQYICPDFYDGYANVDGRADIYSLGILLTNMISGKPPYTGASLAVIQDQHKLGKLPELNLGLNGLPDDLESVIAKSVALNPDDRFLNFKEYTATLEKLKTGVHQYAYSTDGGFEEKDEIVSFQPLGREHEFDEEAVGSATKAQKRKAKPNKAVSAFTTLVTSRNFILSGVALVIILSLVFFGSGEFSFFSESEESTDNGLQTARTSNLQPPGILGKEHSEELSELGSLDSGQTEENLANGDVHMTPESTPDMDEESPMLTTADADEPAAEQSVEATPQTEALVVEESPAEKTPTARTDVAVNKPAAKKPKPEASKPKQQPAQPREDKLKPVAETDKPATQAASVRFLVKAENKPVDAFVFIDEKFRGKTDENGQLVFTDLAANQSYVAKVSKEGFATVTRRFTTQKSPLELSFDIKPKLDIFGTLILDAQPKADSIFVDGKLYQGATPLKISLPWGEHRVRFVNNRLDKSWEQVVNLKVGQVVRVKHDFARAEVGTVAVSLKNAAEFGFAFVYVDGKLWNGNPNTTPVEITLPVGSHTIEVRRDGFSAIPRDIIVVVDKKETKFVSFTLTKNP